MVFDLNHLPKLGIAKAILWRYIFALRGR
jgi:hypothetical protein